MASALSIAPSEFWEGNDGPWSTFNVNVGTKPQQMHVLPATSQSSIWVVIEQGCPASSPLSIDECATRRGGIFNPDSTKDASWQPEQPPNGGNFFALPFDQETTGKLPGYSANAEAGFDTITLDWSGKSAPQNLQSQVVAGYAAPVPYLGQLGLFNIPSHLFDAATTEASPLQTLRNKSSIPSSYWGYTAGAPYRQPQIFGSLTLGGYDAARVDINNALTMTMGETSTTLDVWIANIMISGTATTPVTGPPHLALIDSLVPEIWLPTAACQSFETALGLVWNETVEMYLINDTQHANLQAMNPSITFGLAATSDAQNTTRITLPYAAFDLTAQYPLAGIMDNSSLRYFPLKRSNSTQSSFLGRTFLQEAYVAADYDNNQFHVGQALFPSTQSQTSIVTVDHSSKSQSHGLSGGAIAGIVIGALAGVALIAGLLWFFFARRRKQKYHMANEKRQHRASSIGDTTIAASTEMDEREAQRNDRLNEYFKPAPASPMPEETPNEDGFYKAELDATTTATGFTHTTRHELDASRPAHRSQVSWGSAGSGVSPMSNEGRIRSMQMSEAGAETLSGSPSPPLHGRGHLHGRQMSNESNASGGLFEMGG